MANPHRRAEARRPCRLKSAPRGPRSGIVYLLSLVVVLVVAGVALAMGRGGAQAMRMNNRTIAVAQCEAAALGVLRAVCNDLDASRSAGLLPQLMTVKPEGEVVGDCTVVLVGREPAGAKVRFGLIAEAGKVNVNALLLKTGSNPIQANLAIALANGLAMLPKMDTTVSAAICDWCDADDTPDEAGGAERSDGAYTGAQVPYAPRNGDMQAVEELRLVRGVTDAIYFGEDRNVNGVLEQGEDTDADGKLTPGLRDACTCNSREPAADNSTRYEVKDANALRAPLNKLFEKTRADALYAQVAQAPSQPGPAPSQPGQTPEFTSRLQLFARFTDITDAEAESLWAAIVGPEGRVGLIDAWSCNDVLLVALVGTEIAQSIIAARPATMPTGPMWLVEALGDEGATQYGHLFTVGSYVFRADLLAVRNDGAGWARYEALIDATTDPARIVSLRTTTTHGWPLPWATPEQLRRSQPEDVAAFLASGQP